ncbi:hypothetical protein [Ornithinicoccus hortensis]|uniref:Uncharacterized protein n=1 Tax=Ornithinicoccus hortensis TaxID=82346 RepID=A0A542YRY3_9MICO|nr:hypothetical protein [Ornithinicoccus hortensis]TQL50863.1 hypothetical protein FB467_1983 [Ornithinicoccus hortensis]
MTTGTLDQSTRTTRRPAQWLRVARWQLETGVFLMLWAWGLITVLVVAVLAIVGQSVHVVVSGFAISHHGLLWFPFSIAIMVTVTYLPLHVGSGMTRSSFIKAALLGNVLIGVLNAAFTMVGLLIEREIYHRLGWFHGSTNAKGVEVLDGGALTYGIGLTLLFVSGMLSGLLVGVAYYRAGGWWGTLTLPLTLLPIAVTSLIGLVDDSQWSPWDVSFAASWPASELFTGAVLIAAAAVFALLVRRIPIDT